MAQFTHLFTDNGNVISGINGNGTSAITAGDLLYASPPSTSPFGTTVPSGVDYDEVEVEQFSGGAPCLRIHDQENRYIIADHALDTIDRIWIHFNNNLFGLLTTPTAKTAASGTFEWDSTTVTIGITARVWQQPKKRGALMGSGYTHKNAVDKSLTTLEGLLVDNVGASFYLVLDTPTDLGPLSTTNATLVMRVGTITGTVRLRVYNGTAYTNGSNLTSVDGNSTQALIFVINTVEDFPNFQFGVEGNTSGGIEVKNIYVEYYIYPANFGRQKFLKLGIKLIPPVWKIKLFPGGMRF